MHHRGRAALVGLLLASTLEAAVVVPDGPGSPRLRFGASEVEAALKDMGGGTIVVSTASKEPALAHEGFRIRRVNGAVNVEARDETGAMYGLLDTAEQMRLHGGMAGLEERLCNPRFAFRALKFNLPWSPYRDGPATRLHTATCRDLAFWQRFLDMMARNRYNALTLWNLHPFTYLIRPKGYPEACPFGDAELAEWQRFWHALFAMAADRGIGTYLVNWNIVVSPEFAKAHGVKEHNDTSPLVRDYTRQCVTQVIDEYPELTGLGVTLADWMEGMTPQAREDWIEQTFVAGMQAAHRPIKFIHRSVLAGDPVAMRRVIDHAALPDPVWVEVKFNWSHGHSTPTLAMTHDYASGKVDDRFWNPPPTNYRIAWMVRNEDFFALRWGEPEFIREHLAANGHDYVGGYFVGSEGYIPAAEYTQAPGAPITWQYAFERQWLYYLLWGRLLYDPRTPNEVFAAALEQRFGPGTGERLLRAYTLASRMPLRLASFHAATWDFTLYSEGFLAPAASRGLHDNASPFISIDELIQHETLDPSYLSIPEFVRLQVGKQPIPAGRVTPLALADASQRDGDAALALVEELRAVPSRATDYSCELDDVASWAQLSRYLADKLQAGVALETYRATGEVAQRDQAVALLEHAAAAWEQVCRLTDAHYQAMLFVAGGTFLWSQYRAQVQRDIELARQATPR